jgi:hypothetical protein
MAAITAACSSSVKSIVGMVERGVVAMASNAANYVTKIWRAHRADRAQISNCRRGVRQGSATAMFILAAEGSFQFYQSFLSLYGDRGGNRTHDPLIKSLRRAKRKIK